MNIYSCRSLLNLSPIANFKLNSNSNSFRIKTISYNHHRQPNYHGTSWLLERHHELRGGRRASRRPVSLRPSLLGRDASWPPTVSAGRPHALPARHSITAAEHAARVVDADHRGGGVRDAPLRVPRAPAEAILLITKSRELSIMPQLFCAYVCIPHFLQSSV